MTPEFFPENISVISTKRYLGEKPKAFLNGFDSFNIADHVADDLERVIENRKKLVKYFKLPGEPRYLDQKHSDKCLRFDTPECEGDAIYANKKNEVCAIEETLKAFDSRNLVAHFGPAISQDSFEVGEDVRNQYVSKDKSFTSSFKTYSGKHYLDLYGAAKLVLNSFDIYKISGGTKCTFKQKDEYFSYRRDGKNSGRMANLIWIN